MSWWAWLLIGFLVGCVGALLGMPFYAVILFFVIIGQAIEYSKGINRLQTEINKLLKLIKKLK